jgi:signal transduction histidine kinase
MRLGGALKWIRSHLGVRLYIVGLLQFAVVTFGVLSYGQQVGRSPRIFGDNLAHYISDTLVAKMNDRGALNTEVERLHDTLHWSIQMTDAEGRVITESSPRDRPSDFFGPSRINTLKAPDGSTVIVKTWSTTSGTLGTQSLTWLFALVVVGISSWFIARDIGKPLARLSDTARAFGSGRLEVRAEMDRSDELGEVGRAFDEMADRVGQLLRSEKELIANVSHELRTPLARIRVALDLAAEGDASVARESLGEIAEDLAELESIVDDVLMAARLSLREGTPGGATEPPLRAQRVDVASVLKKSVAKFQSAHPERPVHADLPADLPLIQADPVLLRRVVDNLLDNAHKYTEERDRPIDLQAEADSARVTIWVRDRGMGIAKEDLSRVFEPFFRTDRSRTRATGGLGLGLALARRIVVAHGGTLKLESEVGRGTSARIDVPVPKESVPPPA